MGLPFFRPLPPCWRACTAGVRCGPRQTGLQPCAAPPLRPPPLLLHKHRWDALRTALEAAVDTGGDMPRYRQRWADGDWWWLTTADATVPAGTDIYMNCRKAEEQGLITV